MPIFAFTVGSLGDVIALLQIAETCIKTLCDSRGCSAEYQGLILELHTLVDTVTVVQKAIDSQGLDRLSQSVENALRHSIRTCKHILEQVSEMISRYQLDIQSGNSSMRAMALDMQRRVVWSLFKKDELVAFRAQLEAQITAMNTLLSLAQGERQNRLAEVHRKHYAVNVETHRYMRALYSMLIQSPPIQLYRGGPNNYGNQPFHVHVSRKIFHDFLIHCHQQDPNTAMSLTRELVTRDISSVITTSIPEGRWHPQTGQTCSNSSFLLPQELWQPSNVKSYRHSKEPHHDLLRAPIFFDLKDEEDTYGIRLVDVLDRSDYLLSACEWYSPVCLADNCHSRVDIFICFLADRDRPQANKSRCFVGRGIYLSPESVHGAMHGATSKGELITDVARLMSAAYTTKGIFWHRVVSDPCLSGTAMRDITVEGLVEVSAGAWQPILRVRRQTVPMTLDIVM